MVAAACLALGATAVSSHVLDAKLDKPAYVSRGFVAARLVAYTNCAAAAARKCEAKGAVSSPECVLATGAVAYEPVPGPQTEKFQAALAKCAAKLQLTKKGDDYGGVGCPGDCDPTPGAQPCGGLEAYGAEVARALREQLDLVAAGIDGLCASAGDPAGKERKKCQNDGAKQLAVYAGKLLTCQRRCELDVMGRLGGGGLTNAPVCLVSGGSEGFDACEAKAAVKLKSAAAVALRPQVAAALDAITDELFNREDPTDPESPAGRLSPCGTCGDGVRQGTEQCDGAALGACGACSETCTCALDPILDGPVGTFCTTTLDPATSDYQILCVPTAGTGRHFRIEGLQTLGNNGYGYVSMGFPTMPVGNPATTVGDGRLIVTGGKSQSCDTGWTYVRYSGITDPGTGVLCNTPIFGDYNLGPQTVCFDASADTPPRVTIWATGANGADCKNAATLSAATAVYSKDDWASADNQPVSSSTHFFKLSSYLLATASSVSVSSNTVLP